MQGFLVALILAAAPVIERPASQLRVVVAGTDGAESTTRSGLPLLEWEVLTAFARARKLELSKAAAGSPQALADGSGDVVAGGLHPGSLGAAGVAYSREVVPSRYVVVNRAPAAAIGFVEELRGERVVGQGRAAATIAADAKLRLLDTVDGPMAAFDLLRTGRATAVIVDLHQALAARRADPALQLGVFMGPRQSITFAFREGDPRLPALNTFLAQIRSSPSWGALMLRHLGDEGMAALARARLDQ